jgi:hypothetical protein
VTRVSAACRRATGTIAIVAVVALLGHGAAGAAPSGSVPVPAEAAAGRRPADVPPDDARRGLHYGDLRRADAAKAALCRHYEMRLASGEVACTHGPDPAPEDVDVRQPRAIPSVAAEDAAFAAATLACQGDGTSGPRVQLVYARAAGVADRYSSLAANFVEWAARVDDIVNQSAAETGGVRHVRFVHNASCQPVVARVQLTNAGDDNLTNTIDELRSQGYNRNDRKYLVWVDANVYCGIAQVYEDDRPTADNNNNGRSGIPGMVARVDNGCWGHSSSVEAHELVHGLGAVQGASPNATANGHCTDDYDRMCYVDGQGVVVRVVCGSTAHEARLDCNHDDYFSTAPVPGTWLATHWNTANSAFLTGGGGTSPPTTTVPPTTTTTRPPVTTTTTRPPVTTTTTRPPVTTTVPPTTTTTVPSGTLKTQRFVDRAHRDLLGRAPSPAETNFWVNVLATGYPRSSMGANMVTSDEYRRSVVNRYYQTYLGRPAPAADLDAWLNVMRDHQWHFEWIATMIVGSDEYYARSGGTVTAFVNSLFGTVGLLPDAAGAAFWVGQLLGGLDRYTVALAFLDSTLARWNSAAAAYNLLLDRPGSGAELEYWLGHLNQGLRSEYVLAFLLGSEEYWAKS